jgi:hypothetical protein
LKVYRSGYARVPEDVVVLRRPALLGARPVVVRPDDLVHEARAAEDLIQHHLAVVNLARVDMEEQAAGRLQHATRLDQPRPQKAEEVVEAVGVPARRLARRSHPLGPIPMPPKPVRSPASSRTVFIRVRVCRLR